MPVHHTNPVDNDSLKQHTTSVEVFVEVSLNKELQGCFLVEHMPSLRKNNTSVHMTILVSRVTPHTCIMQYTIKATRILK